MRRKSLKYKKIVKVRSTVRGIYHGFCIEYGHKVDAHFADLLMYVGKVWGDEKAFRDACEVIFENYEELKRELGWKWFIKGYEFPHPRIFLDSQCVEWIREKLKQKEAEKMEEKAVELKDRGVEIIKKIKEGDSGYFEELFEKYGEQGWVTVKKIAELYWASGMPERVWNFLHRIKPKKRSVVL